MSKRKLEPLDEAVCVSPDCSVYEAAEVMNRRGIGCLVVEDEAHMPVGIVTDRDLTLRVVAWSQDTKSTPISDVMTQPVECVDEEQGLAGVMKRMTALGVRRVPITRDGKVTGLVSFDDLVQELSFDLSSLSMGTAGALSSSRKQARREELLGEAEQMLREIRKRLRSANWHAKEVFLEELDEVREQVSKVLKGKAL